MTELLTAIPTLTVHATYASGDYVGTSGVAMVFTGARDSLESGVIFSAQLIDKVQTRSTPMDLLLFDSAVTPPADSAAWTISDADMAHFLGCIQFKSYNASAANTVSLGENQNAGAPVFAYGGAKEIYGCLIARGIPASDFADGDLTVRLGVIPD